MKLSDLTPTERRELATKAGTNPVYLWQCATGRRTPSPRLAKKLIDADGRLSLESIYDTQKQERAA
ncbi:hypothetical protein [Niveibacterium terrae]|uniref:hypothetical protein n=1 Tax=Niveibacterium terrae TaxID=3373598 RepID=UPI003A923E25